MQSTAGDGDGTSHIQNENVVSYNKLDKKCTVDATLKKYVQGIK